MSNLIIFSTNLDPRELVDEAFLRRIQHKIEVGPPDRGLYTEIFKLCCAQRTIEFNPKCLSYLYETFYDKGSFPARAIREICWRSCGRFVDSEGRTLSLPKIWIAEAAHRFFVQM